MKVHIVSRDTEDGEHTIEGVWTDEAVADEVAVIINVALGLDEDFGCIVNVYEVDEFSVEDIRRAYADDHAANNNPRGE